jgi:cellobiose-specific phosphotransferase system component IIA
VKRKDYESNTNGICSSFSQFYNAHNIFQTIITDVFDNGGSIDNAFLLAHCLHLISTASHIQSSIMILKESRGRKQTVR